MHGAILGDVWGSVFETIPKFPRRLFMTPTDDSFLTCACYEFMQSLSDKELKEPFTNFDTIYNKSVFFLKKWGKMFPEPGAFSSGFLNWANEAGTKYKVASTNGCLMRQSPIALYSIINNIPLANCIEISRIFCYPTHKSDESFSASLTHIKILYLALNKTLNKNNLPTLFPELIQDLFSWQSIASEVKNNFIWKASDSLGIAISAIHYSNNWDDMMRFFISISGDVDTYAAIAGPIAQILFHNPHDLLKLEHVLINNYEPRFNSIFKIYNLLKNDFDLMSERSLNSI